MDNPGTPESRGDTGVSLPNLTLPVNRKAPPPFSGRSNVIFALLAVSLWFVTYWPRFSRTPLDHFYDHLGIALRLSHDSMLIYEAASRLSPLQRTFLTLHGTHIKRIPHQCEQMLRDVIGHLERSPTNRVAVDELRANLAVVLAETGALTNALDELEKLGSSSDSDSFVRAFHIVYTTGNPDAEWSGIQNPASILVSGWAYARFLSRCLRTIGEENTANWQDGWVEHAAADRIIRLGILNALTTLLQVAGIICLAAFVLRRMGERFSAMPSVAWAGSEYWGLFFRAVTWGLLATHVLGWLPLIEYISYLSYLLTMGVPIVALLWYRHWRIDPLAIREFFGIPEDYGLRRTLAWAALGLFATAWLALTWIPAVMESFGIESRWTDYVDEVLLTWPSMERHVRLVDGIIWGPIYEEILYRGLLFGALRSRLSFVPSAALSTVVFAVPHFYSMPGFLSVATFGFLCAVAREKTGSLLPCIMAHILVNLLILGGEFWVYQ